MRESLTMNKRSFVMVEAKASANPAKEALILGVTRHATPAAPMMPAERRLNRIDNQRLTSNAQ